MERGASHAGGIEGRLEDRGRQLPALCQPALPHADLTSDSVEWDKISPRLSFSEHFPTASYVLGPGVRGGRKRREVGCLGPVTQDTQPFGLAQLDTFRETCSPLANYCLLLRAEVSPGDSSPSGLREYRAFPMAPQPPPVAFAWPAPTLLLCFSQPVSLLGRSHPSLGWGSRPQRGARPPSIQASSPVTDRHRFFLTHSPFFSIAASLMPGPD